MLLRNSIYFSLCSKFDICSLCSHSIIKRSESVLAQASERRLLCGGSFCKRAECEAPRRMPCAEVEYMLPPATMVAMRPAARPTHNVTSLALPFWQRISSALALYRVLYISSVTRYAKHIERRVSDASRRSAPPSLKGENERKKSNLPLFCRLLSLFEYAFTTHTFIEGAKPFIICAKGILRARKNTARRRSNPYNSTRQPFFRS